MVGIDADFLVFGIERKQTAVHGLEFVMILEIGPAPHTTVDDVRKALAV